MLSKKPLPIGISDYRDVCTNYYYVDKTMMIKTFLDERPKVSLFTRPRRFGKTLNMDMLRVFFERTGEDTSCYFRDKKIWSCGEFYQQHQGKYPGIFLSFKDVKCSSWEKTYLTIANLIRHEYKRHPYLTTSEKVMNADFHDMVIQGRATEIDNMLSLRYLSQSLHEYYGIPPIIIIDEYDVPIQQGYVNGFYDDVVSFLRNLFSGGLKDNSHLSFGFMTGVLRIAKESVFSGLNNIKVNSILDDRYSEYFGFTVEEVKGMAQYYRVPEKYSEISEWYNGYLFGNTPMFNPWSVISYFGNNCKPKPFWLSTSSNDILRDVLSVATPELLAQLQQLLQGESVAAYIDISVVYPQLKSDPSAIYSFLLMAGYLKYTSCESFLGSDFICDVVIPNKEISAILGQLPRYC